ncbi:MAG TPA: hypothetical protein P5519_07085 [Spirochaetia bacterium]|nr:hypothetical protein [Spirochaetales bacterium]HPD80816.1 hypothetical protein [Spirochaetales bacterium]HQK33207.1 hypothetical protein [Spirochaetales bacterium]HRS65637.1 hypothetical protein [Spirochaetia bacterium]HRV28288.1 hypothetical protein [Spirochaetia bacterium]
MQLEIQEVNRQVLELVYPELKYGEDPDIERYFDYRSQGRMFDALVIYQSKLKPRYPDDAKRIELLSLYRKKSPLFSQYLYELLSERADSIIKQLKINLDTMLMPIENISLKNTYRVLKAVETIARLLPENNEQALNMLSFYETVSQTLQYRYKEFKKLSELLTDFYEQTAIKELEAFDFLSLNESALLEQKRREEEYRKHENYFDISKIEFDETDKQAIEISPRLERNEDKVLAFCYKYWLRIDDAAFERIVFLYSQKYHSKHYDIFRTIKFCRKRKYSDDDILTMVATALSTDYSYTVQGDIYMQETWRRLKASLYGTGKLNATVPVTTQSKLPGTNQNKSGSALNHKKSSAHLRTEKPLSRKTVPVLKPIEKAVPKNKTNNEAQSLAKELEQRRKLLTRPVSSTKQDTVHLIYTGSISDKVRKISGRSYDVFQDLFFSKVRTFIQDALHKARIPGSKVPGDKLNMAEDLVYACMKKNYLNTYFDWPNSHEYRQLKEYGFDLQTLDGIIEHCMLQILEKEQVI